MSALLLFYRKLTLKIAETFAPKKEPVDAVKLWLEEHGITEDRISISKSLSWVRFESTVGEAEKLLQTKYKVYEHSETKKPHITCDEYSLPAHITEHVDFVSPTIGFDAFLTQTKSDPTFWRRGRLDQASHRRCCWASKTLPK